MTMAPHNIYHVQMTEAKLRILAAERVLMSSASPTGLLSLDSEFCFLQIRKVIEIITFAGMIREEQRYSHFRKSEKRKVAAPDPDPASDWNAKKILEKLVKLSPHVLPIPLGALSQIEPGVLNFDHSELAVNHHRLIEIYDASSEFMHAPNPLVADYKVLVESQRVRYYDARNEAQSALTFLRQLLWLHAAVQLEWTDTRDPASVNNPTSAWIVDFSHPVDDVVIVTLALADAEDGNFGQ